MNFILNSWFLACFLEIPRIIMVFAPSKNVDIELFGLTYFIILDAETNQTLTTICFNKK